jgi:hypothetical protein
VANEPQNSQQFIQDISDQQIEIFARRLLPEIKKFFADENIRLEFEQWKKRQNAKPN